MAFSSKIYANAVAKYMEGKLLDSDKIKRLVDADFSSCLKMLCDYGYNDGINDTNDIDTFIAKENKKLIDFVQEYASSEELKKCLLNKFLYSNAKLAYKSRFVDIDTLVALYPLDDDIFDDIKNGDYNNLPPIMAQALEELDKINEEKNVSSLTIDILLTSAYYNDTLLCAKKLKNKNLYKLYQTEIDLSNLLTLLRAKKMNMQEKVFSSMLIKGGFIAEDELISYYHLEGDKLLDNIDDRYYDIMSEVLSTGDFVEYERKFDMIIYSLTTKNADNMLTDDPIINYFYVKNLENRMVKTILVCLKNNAQGEIARRLRDIYE